MSRWLWISWAVALCMMSARVTCAAETPPVADQLASAGMVAQLLLDGPIGPAAAEYFDDASKHAVADGAVAIVLRLDTPGGLADSMRQIITGMLACKVPVLVYVAPGGARAASAGTYILYAGQIAAMAPATHVGAATPVSLGGGTPMPFPKIGDQPASAEKPPAQAPPAENERCRVAQGFERFDRLHPFAGATTRAQCRVGRTGGAWSGHVDRRRSGASST